MVVVHLVTLITVAFAGCMFPFRDPHSLLLSEDGFQRIATQVRYHPRPYNDGEAEPSPFLYDRMYQACGNCRVGYGHFLHYYACHPKETTEFLSEEDALQVLRFDLSHAEIAVRELVSIPLVQDQFDALVSFIFSCGRWCFEESSLRASLENRNYDEAAYWWVRTGTINAGEIVPLWIDQRREEIKWFMRPILCWREKAVNTHDK